jgi:hypothetical protein
MLALDTLGGSVLRPPVLVLVAPGSKRSLFRLKESAGRLAVGRAD